MKVTKHYTLIRSTNDDFIKTSIINWCKNVVSILGSILTLLLGLILVKLIITLVIYCNPGKHIAFNPAEYILKDITNPWLIHSFDACFILACLSLVYLYMRMYILRLNGAPFIHFYFLFSTVWGIYIAYLKYNPIHCLYYTCISLFILLRILALFDLLIEGYIVRMDGGTPPLDLNFPVGNNNNNIPPNNPNPHPLIVHERDRNGNIRNPAIKYSWFVVGMEAIKGTNVVCSNLQVTYNFDKEIEHSLHLSSTIALTRQDCISFYDCPHEYLYAYLDDQGAVRQGVRMNEVRLSWLGYRIHDNMHAQYGYRPITLDENADFLYNIRSQLPQATNTDPYHDTIHNHLKTILYQSIRRPMLRCNICDQVRGLRP